MRVDKMVIEWDSTENNYNVTFIEMANHGLCSVTLNLSSAMFRLYSREMLERYVRDFPERNPNEH